MSKSNKHLDRGKEGKNENVTLYKHKFASVLKGLVDVNAFLGFETLRHFDGSKTLPPLKYLEQLTGRFLQTKSTLEEIGSSLINQAQ